MTPCIYTETGVLSCTIVFVRTSKQRTTGQRFPTNEICIYMKNFLQYWCRWNGALLQWHILSTFVFYPLLERDNRTRRTGEFCASADREKQLIIFHENQVDMQQREKCPEIKHRKHWRPFRCSVRELFLTAGLRAQTPVWSGRRRKGPSRIAPSFCSCFSRACVFQPLNNLPNVFQNIGAAWDTTNMMSSVCSVCWRKNYQRDYKGTTFRRCPPRTVKDCFHDSPEWKHKNGPVHSIHVRSYATKFARTLRVGLKWGSVATSSIYFRHLIGCYQSIELAVLFYSAGCEDLLELSQKDKNKV